VLTHRRELVELTQNREINHWPNALLINSVMLKRAVSASQSLFYSKVGTESACLLRLEWVSSFLTAHQHITGHFSASETVKENCKHYRLQCSSSSIQIRRPSLLKAVHDPQYCQIRFCLSPLKGTLLPSHWLSNTDTQLFSSKKAINIWIQRLYNSLQ